MLMNMTKLVADAKEKGYGIIAATPLTLEEIHWSFIAADRRNSPVIISANPAYRAGTDPSKENKTFGIVARTTRYYAQKYPHIPCALCLDHGDSLELAVKAIKAGYTGVMVDKSMCDDKTNIAEMVKVCKVAHAMDVGVEAGLGGTTWRDPTFEEIEANLTKVDVMKRMVEESGVDVVAVFVGGSHGDHKDGKAFLHFDLIEELRDCSSAALCMHGTSQTGDEKIREGAKSGLSKFNVAGDLRIGAVKKFEKFLDSEEYKERRNVADFFKVIKDGYVERTADYMGVIGSNDRI